MWKHKGWNITIPGKNYFAYFPYISHLFELLESNLMEINLSELTLTSFNSV
jgi:hypothetical protein